VACIFFGTRLHTGLSPGLATHGPFVMLVGLSYVGLTHVGRYASNTCLKIPNRIVGYDKVGGLFIVVFLLAYNMR
jgi:hypothetical protein